MGGTTHPAILLTELLSGEGPHQHLAELFLVAECVECGGDVGRQGRVVDEAWWCPSCWAWRAAERRKEVKPARR